MPPLVSAIIPTYNYGRFLGRAIDSVLAQTYAPLECIVVDDASTDDTPEVVAGYGDRIRAFRQENGGVSAARNTAIRASRGAYLAFLDADDVWRPAKIARQVELLEASPGVGAVGCAFEVVDGVSPPRAMPIRPDAGDLPRRLRRIAIRESWVEGSASGACVPRRVLDEVGLFDEGLFAAEDWDMWLRIAARYPIRNVPDVLVQITRHSTGVFRNPERMQEGQLRVYESAIARWPELLDAFTRRRMRALILADAGAEYLGRGQRAAAMARLLASLREWPLERSRWAAAARLALRSLRS